MLQGMIFRLVPPIARMQLIGGLITALNFAIPNVPIVDGCVEIMVSQQEVSCFSYAIFYYNVSFYTLLVGIYVHLIFINIHYHMDAYSMRNLIYCKTSQIDPALE